MPTIADIVARLIISKPHYGVLLSQIERQETKEPIPAASTVNENGDFVIHYNQDMLDKMTMSQAASVMEHECLHIVNKHHFRGKDLGAMVEANGSPITLSNIAGDLAINQFIPDLPVGCVEFETFEKQGFVGKADRNNSMEYYYGKLLQKLPKSQQCQGGHGKGGPGQQQQGGSGQQPGSCQGHDTAEDQMEQAEKTHKHLTEPIKNQSVAEKNLEKIVNQTIKHLKDINQWGNMPMELQRMYMEALKSRNPWASILRRFVRGTMRAQPRRTLMRWSRRLGEPFAGRKYRRRGKVAVMIDTSGSIGDDILGMMGGELDKMKDSVDMVVGFVDTKLHAPFIFRGKMNKPVGGGGTDFNSFLAMFTPGHKHTKEERIFKGCEAVVLLTDGHCAPITKAPAIPALLCLTPNGEVPKGVKWLTVIKMDDPKSLKTKGF